MTTTTRQADPSFDEAYSKAPFSDLIRLSVGLAGGFVKLRDRLVKVNRSSPVA